MIETWKPVVGYEGRYEVSDKGNVRSIRRLVRCRGGHRQAGGITLKPVRCNQTHLWVNLYSDGKARSRLIHHLVLEAFVGPRPNDEYGCHNDGNPENNALTNVRWDTQSSNILDAVRHGTHPESSKTHCPQGHEYNLANTRIYRGKRRCRACHRNAEKQRYHMLRRVV